jgi:hypothetical protein
MNTQENPAGAWQETLYVILAIAGLVGTWAQVFGYFDAGFLGGNIAFWKDTLVTPASRFIVVDIFVLGAALFTWMFSEGRRLGIGAIWLWAYFAGSVLIAISCAFPLFLAHRQRLLRTRHPQQQAAPGGGDLVAVAFTVILALAAVVYSLLHMPG